MVKLIKLDPSSDSYLYSKSSNREVNMINIEDNDIIVHINNDGEELEFTMDQVSKQYNGPYYVLHNDTKIFIDDGYYTTLCSAGYLILNDYDKDHLEKEEGVKVLNTIGDDVDEAIVRMVDNYLKDNDTYELSKSFSNGIVFKTKFYEYHIYINPIVDIIAENQKRKLNDLPFYPYIKGMDKYGTVYVRAFAKLLPNCTKKEADEAGASKYSELNNLMKNFVVSINKLDSKRVYHYEPVSIKKLIINF